MRAPPFAGVFLLAAAVFGAACGPALRTAGLKEGPPESRRSGLMGFRHDPAPLNPFETTELVMAGDECRFYRLKVPSGWTWKLRLTAASRRPGVPAEVHARILPESPPWGEVPNAARERVLRLASGGTQVLLGVANPLGDRMAVLELCQVGGDVGLILESEVAPYRMPLLPRGRERKAD